MINRTYNLDPSKYDPDTRTALDEILDEANACTTVAADAQALGKAERANTYRHRRAAIVWTLEKLGYPVVFNESKGYYDLD